MSGEAEVLTEDHFFLQTTGLLVMKGCSLGLTCAYRMENAKYLIDHTGTHTNHEGNNLMKLLVEVTLNRVTTHAGSSFCAATATWKANYVMYLVHSPTGDLGLGWPALFREFA
jgi:hypothetical protein